LITEKGSVEISKSPIDREALQSIPVQIEDITRDRRFQYPKEAKKEGIRTILCVPLEFKNRLLGVLRIYAK
jgi:GAF domain-containing protein